MRIEETDILKLYFKENQLLNIFAMASIVYPLKIHNPENLRAIKCMFFIHRSSTHLSLFISFKFIHSREMSLE